MGNQDKKAEPLGEYATYPVLEIKKLYLCRAAHEQTLLQFEGLKAENALLKAEIKKLNALLVSELSFIA